MSDVTRPVRMKDVAARAGVSPGLVSRLLNNDPSLTIRPDTRQAILDAVRELDYVPDSTATALRRSRTDSIGLVLKHITSPVFADIVRGAQLAAAEAGCVLLLIDADEVEDESPLFEAMIKAHRMDGLLLQGGYGPGDERLLHFTSLIPSVVVNSDGNEFASGVRLQDDAATFAATQHLLDLGHREIAFVAGPTSRASERRVDGFLAALAQAGLKASSDAVMTAGWEPSEGTLAIEQSLQRGYRPTAYVVASSGAALGVLAALTHSGVRVPEDASVIAIHDSWFAPFQSPPLTTVALPLLELGRQAVAQLMLHLRGGRPDDIVIESPGPQLVLRESTAPPRPRDGE